MAIVTDKVAGGKRRWNLFADSLPDLVAWINATPRKWRSAVSSTERPSQRWDANVGYARALHLAQYGWQQGADDMVNVKLQTVPTEKTARFSYDVAGHLPDVPKFLSGDPANMLRRGPTVARRPVVSLIISIGGNCFVTATQMMNYGKAMLAIVDQLEHTGRRVEVIGNWTTQDMRGGGASATISWQVKNAQDPVDLAALAFGLAHPAMQRRLGFAALERSSVPEMSAYGMTRAATAHDIFDPEAQALLLPGLDQFSMQCNTPEGAAQMAAEQINKAAGEQLVQLV